MYETQVRQQRAWDKFPNMRPNMTSDAEEIKPSVETLERREDVEY